MGLISFLQRHEANRLARRQISISKSTNKSTKDILDDMDDFLSAKMWSTIGRVKLHVKTPNGEHTVEDAMNRPIKVDVPHRYEKVTPEGEIVTVEETITIELEITHG
ncbi:hypothetical protein PBI_CANTARE_63 [Brevibacterium phage Cantare]|uniref:Uncharacterized protein n=1 Tax=Brevibacterium phage Cantare TaxID=2338395 RepID=A0A3G3LZM3_9CAUD|nr:hypothetical protein PQD70_gp063 [Brevibacterium phage Cantare]AYQ99283.1 hypothetical protein PBI_CANTARE_63 [Brevibacterium phage Cantare]